MRILITGANGFVGKNLSEFLEQKGHETIKLTRKEADLADNKSVDKFLQSFSQEIDVIIHTAFKLCSVEQSEQEQMQNFKDNISITENVIKIAKQLNPKKLINFSSMAVYPNVNGSYSEISEIRPSQNPEGMYGLAKFVSENLITLNLKNIQHIHLRLAQVYGEGMRSDRIIPIMKKELEEKNTITVFGMGERVSCFINIEKLCNIILKLLAKDIKGIFNVGDENISYLELAQKIIKKYGNEKSKTIKIDKGSRAKFYLNCDKLKNII